MGSFSNRHGYVEASREIRFRDELPIELRPPIIRILQEYASASLLRSIVAQLFDPYQISTLPEFRMTIQAEYGETQEAIDFRRFFLYCSWSQAYDVIEELLDQLAFHEAELVEPGERDRWFPLQRDLNQYFVYAGIGWQLEEGKLGTRGNEGFQNAVETAEFQLRETKRPTAAYHIHSALIALSQRPYANTPGAVSHATSAVESLLNDITGEALTLGKFLDRYPSLFHPSLKKGLDGVYGYASDAGARHGREGRTPSFEEAQFAVTICAAACTLLTAMNRRGSSL